MAHGQAQCPVGLKSGYTGMEGWPCQRVSLYKDSKMASGSVKILSWVNDTCGMAEPRIRAFLRLLWLRCLNDKTSHRFQDEDIPDCLQSPIFERREKENEQLGWLIVWKSAVHPKPIAIARFAAHSITSAKCKMKPRLESDCISPIGLYSI